MRAVEAKMEAVYTVEAAAIFGLTIGFIFLMIVLGFNVYYAYTDEILTYEKSEVEPADLFRLISYGKMAAKEVFGN